MFFLCLLFVARVRRVERSTCPRCSSIWTWRRTRGSTWRATSSWTTFTFHTRTSCVGQASSVSYTVRFVIFVEISVFSAPWTTPQLMRGFTKASSRVHYSTGST